MEPLTLSWFLKLSSKNCTVTGANEKPHTCYYTGPLTCWFEYWLISPAFLLIVVRDCTSSLPERDLLGSLGSILWFSSVHFSHSIVSDSLWTHESQHARPPCPSPTPGVYPNSCLSSQWCHPAISSSVVPFSSCPQSLPASKSFPMGQLFASGGQSIGVSTSASVLPMNTQDWSPLRWTGWISLQCKGFSRVFSNTIFQKHQFFRAQLSSQSSSHIHTWSLEKQ